MTFFRRRRRTPTRVQTPWSEEHAADLFTYEMLLLRQLEQDSMLWQTPALAITGQAFLLTIALDTNSVGYSRLVAALLGIVVSAVSMQLMHKHRKLYRLDGQLLLKLEQRLKIPELSKRSWEHPKPRDSKWSSSYNWWIGGLLAFVVVNVVVVIAVAKPWELIPGL